jgi:hypothetical protein
MAGQRTHGDVTVALPDVRQLADAGDVDEHRGRREPQLHERQQGVATGDQFGVVTVFREQRDGFVGGSGAYEVELRGDHDATAFAARMASQTCCGDAGMVTSRTPMGASASTTAFMTAGVDAIAPASPMPLTPIGFVGLGVTV